MIEELSEVLQRIGISPQLNGYDYSKYAIMLAIQEPNRTKRITNDLYPAVAQHFNVNYHNVERCIRTSIESAWLKGDYDFNNTLFKYTIDKNRGKPTNAVFIYVISQYMLNKYSD